MNSGRTIVAQVMDPLPIREFQKCVVRYRGDHNWPWGRLLESRDHLLKSKPDVEEVALVNLAPGPLHLCVSC